MSIFVNQLILYMFYVYIYESFVKTQVHVSYFFAFMYAISQSPEMTIQVSLQLSLRRKLLL